MSRGRAAGGGRFIASAPQVDLLPRPGLPEIAFAGRSNVGKSSLLGRLLGNPRLVRTSRTPGRTQALNLFLFEERLALVDLPGYGYAKLSHRMREDLALMIRAYLAQRGELTGVVQVMDARREQATQDDRDVAAWVLRHGRPLLVALTKIDLVPKNRRLHQARLIERDLGLPAGTAVPCSGKTGEGRDELVKSILELITA